MTIFEELLTLLNPILPTSCDVSPEVPPDTYAVLVSLDDQLALHADDEPQIEIPSVRISVFTKYDYLELVKSIKKMLLANDFAITSTHKVGYEIDTEYHHYAIETEKDYKF